MPELLIELFSEEIPARMQKRAEEDLARLLKLELDAARVPAQLYEDGLRTFSSPRRLGIVIADLPAMSLSLQSERKGPKVGAPDAAIQGFVKSAGLKSIKDAQVVEDPKGNFYVARRAEEGRPLSQVIAEVVPKIIRAFPWPKSMRSQSSDMQWVRPLHNVLCVFDGKAVKIEIEGVGAEAVTWGHRFHAPQPIAVTNAAEHASKLRAAKVLIEREERKAIILEQAKQLCAAKGLELVEDIGLLEEVAGLVEWPVVLLGDMDPAFLDLPGEVIRLSMRTHQKYFAVRAPKTGKLAPHFVVVANVDAKDGGKAIAAGNARVLSARLNDARFFWDTDRKLPLDDASRIEKLKKIVFHQKLGSVWDKVERVKALAKELCAVTGADPKLVERAAHLSKCDLVTETVGEFPELQGQIGRQLAGKENASVAIAIEDHYRPLGPNDRVPTDKVAVTLALADKLDTLTAFWAIDERPTGSSDPYALRRAALGLVRIVLENSLRFSLANATEAAMFDVAKRPVEHRDWAKRSAWSAGARDMNSQFTAMYEVIAFLADRLKVQLRDQGKRHDLVDAVFALGDDDLVRIVARVEALDAFLKTEDGANLLAGYKRAANILAAEEKKGKGLTEADIAAGLDASKLAEPAEKALNDALAASIPKARAAVEKEDFAAAMRALSGLRAPVDAFFEKVLVNAEDPLLRRNRLLLLSRLREALSAVADFSKIEG